MSMIRDLFGDSTTSDQGYQERLVIAAQQAMNVGMGQAQKNLCAVQLSNSSAGTSLRLPPPGEPSTGTTVMVMQVKEIENGYLLMFSETMGQTMRTVFCPTLDDLGSKVITSYAQLQLEK